MTFKSATQPFCLWCHKPIAKDTTRHNLVTPAQWQQSFNQRFESMPKTRADCQRLTNEQVVSVEYQYETDNDHDRTGRRVIHSYSTWDGRSYKDQFFCNGDHAKTFGYAAAHHGLRFKKRNAAA